MEQATAIYSNHGLTISVIDAGLVFEFEDDDMFHGFNVNNDALRNPKAFAKSAADLVEWLGPTWEPSPVDA